ncbi:hypothetical protein [Sinorhizobium medicae]|uniref:hypothetical protein n=1 Tax=Sinorhizobium medicae TaxID=110321 RepID=UPI000FD8D20B|nr:hypothetical protein [Sinorhizobium medicae]RVJ23435.1 hypothetical protein CN179_24770 [Sinorhizobium medicae]
MAHKRMSKTRLSDSSEQIAELIANGLSRKVIAVESGLSEAQLWQLLRGQRKPSAHEAQAVNRLHRRYVALKGNTVAGVPLQGKLGSISRHT